MAKNNKEKKIKEISRCEVVVVVVVVAVVVVVTITIVSSKKLIL